MKPRRRFTDGHVADDAAAENGLSEAEKQAMLTRWEDGNPAGQKPRGPRKAKEPKMTDEQKVAAAQVSATMTKLLGKTLFGESAWRLRKA